MHRISSTTTNVTTIPRVLVLLTAAVIALGSMSACSSGDSPTGPQDSTPSVSVSLTFPSSGQQVSGSIQLFASAQNAERVIFYVDGVEIGSATTSPYQIPWNTTSVVNGGHIVKVRAARGTAQVDDVADVIVNNTGGGIGVAITPSSVTLSAGQTQQFQSQVVGTTNTSVTWTVVEGPTRGSISASGLFTAPNVIPTPATATVRATSLADPSKFATASLAFLNDGGGDDVQVTVTAPSSQIELGQSVQLTASVTGTSNTQVTWSVLEGASHGTITSNGSYTAPGALPSPPNVTLRATSIADPSRSGQTTLTLVDNSSGPFSQEELGVIRLTYGGGFEIRSAIDEANDLVIRAVFFASCSNGQTLTTTGTITEVGVDTGNFTYSPSPQDRLRIVFGSGASLDIVVTAFDGDVGSLDCDDNLSFEGRHTNLRYQITTPIFQLEIASASFPSDDFDTTHQRLAAGTFQIEGVTWSVEAELSGTSTFIFSESGSNSRRNDVLQAVLTSSSSRIEVQHEQFFKDDFFSGSGNSFSEGFDTINNQGTLTGQETVFGFPNTTLSWTDTNERDPIYEGSGSLTQNGQVVGQFVFDPQAGAVRVLLTGGQVVDL